MSLVSPSEVLTRTTRTASGLCVRVRFGGFIPPTRTGSFYLRDFRVIPRIVRTKGQDEGSPKSTLFTGSNPDTLTDPPVRGCVTCGRAFSYRQRSRRYCDKRCQQKAYRARLAMEGNYNQITGRPLVSSRRAA